MALGNSKDTKVATGSDGPSALALLRWETDGGAAPQPDGADEGDDDTRAGDGAVILDFGAEENARLLDAEWLKRKLGVEDGTVAERVVVRHALIEVRAGETLDLSRLTFGRGLHVTDSVFKGDVDFSSCTFEGGLDLSGTFFEGRARFRGARVEGDFRMPLAGFAAPAGFEDLYVREVLDAEGADFAAACFDRAEVRKSARFCCALLEDGRAVRTRFRGEVTFNDARLGGPLYFAGAHFGGKAYFDRARVDSSVFFNCDLLSTQLDPAQPRHEVRRAPRRRVRAEKRACIPTEFEETASFIGAHVNGSASFSGARFGREGAPAPAAADESAPRADFRRVQIEGTALFDPFVHKDSGTFRRVSFHYDANFWNASIKGAARFDAAHFGGRADFEHVQVGRRAYFDAAGPAQKPVSARFCAGVNFIDADIEGTVSFEGACFEGDADFERLTTGGSLYFRSYVPDAPEADGPADGAGGGGVIVPVRFERSVRFHGCQTRSNVEFGGAQFVAAPPTKNGAAEKDEANFARMVVGGSFSLRPRSGTDAAARFEKKAVFTGVEIKGRAWFSGASFVAPADFTGMHVHGNAHFDHWQSPEGGEARGEGAAAAEAGERQRRTGSAAFHDVADFNSATFDNRVSFEGVVFERKADFTGVRGAGEVNFEGAKFKSDAVFREARFSSLRFDRRRRRRSGLLLIVAAWLWALRRGRASYTKYRRQRADARAQTRQFRGAVDLRGCVYDRIEVKLRSLLRRVKAAENEDLHKYDRQPYTQMSKALRAVGDDRRAEFVYVKQRIRELVLTWNRLLRDLRSLLLWRAFRDLANLLLDLLLWAVAQFGVQPERLLVISFVVVAVGARVFSFKDAVQYREPDPAQPPTATIVTRDREPWTLAVNAREKNTTTLGWHDSLRLSVSQFLPVVDIPSGSKWKPAERGDFCFLPCGLNVPRVPFDVYGSLHRLLGAILVPLLLAAVAASLYRRFKTEM